MSREICVHELKDGHGIDIIDVREFPEFANGAIPKSKHAPLGSLPQAVAGWDRNKEYVCVCKSGRRSSQAARILEDLGFTSVKSLKGGVEAWQSAGLPLDMQGKAPWSLERQVRVIAGTMVVLWTLLGLFLSPWFFIGTFAVGGGLTFAGISDTCLMANLLSKMPWNVATTRCDR